MISVSSYIRGGELMTRIIIDFTVKGIVYEDSIYSTYQLLTSYRPEQNICMMI